MGLVLFLIMSIRQGSVMLFMSLLLSLLCSVVAGNLNSLSTLDRAKYEHAFTNWLNKHQHGELSPEQRSHYLANFIANDLLISNHNSNPHATFHLGHNKFSHLNATEWSALIRNNVLLSSASPITSVQARDTTTTTTNVTALPSSIDWTKKGAVTPVKNQGKCGSCWSFSATGAIEGASQIKYGKLISLSEQHFIDCDNSVTNQGCDGGSMDGAFTWASHNGGVCAETTYTYTSGMSGNAGVCRQTNCNKVPHSAPKSFVNVAANSDVALMTALTAQPVAVAIDAQSSSFMLYNSGVYTDSGCGNSLTHGVLVVGYGQQGGLAFYKIKNSWGVEWGLGGFMLLQRGANKTQGLCGVLSSPSYPVM